MKNKLSGLLVFLFLGVALSAQTLDDRIKNVVDGLAQRTRIEVLIYPPVIQGTDTPTALSRYLHQKIGTYAVINNSFSVVQPSRGGPPKGRIEGSYLQAGDKVIVTLKLISDRDLAVAAGEFDISLDELERLNLAWLPDNRETQEEVQQQEEIFAPVPLDIPVSVSGFAVEVWPNSETRTYYDGEKLEIRVRANRDCYFKVYHVDVHGRIQLIFPNVLDYPGTLPLNRDNFLPADTELAVPRGTVDFVLGEPFGQETILMYAAAEQFPGIEEEMLSASTGTMATRETVANLGRGGSLVNSAHPGVVGARFSFTILGKR
jgi:hypothetical protein